MARLWSSGIELQSTTAGVEFEYVSISSGSTFAIDTTKKHGGVASLKFNLISSTGYSYFSQTLPTHVSGRTYYYRFYICLDSLPDNITSLFTIGTSSVSHVDCRLKADGKLELWDMTGPPGTNLGTSTNSLSADGSTWYRVEFSVVYDTKAVELRIDGNTEITATTGTFASDSNINVGTGFHSADLGQGATFYIDDIAVNDSTGSYCNSWCGAEKLVLLSPDSTGDNGTWAGDYTAIDEIPPVDTDYISSDVVGDIEDVNLSATPADLSSSNTVTIVHVGMRFALNNSTKPVTFYARAKASSGGTLSEVLISPSSTVYTTNAASSPFMYPITLYTLPGTSTAWTKTTLDSAQIGVRTNSVGQAGKPGYVSSMWLLAGYVPTAVATNTKTLTAKVKIKNTINRTVQSKARVKIGGNTKTITAKVDIKRGGGTVVNTYYFDGSGSIADPENIWTDDSNAFDGSTSTYAYCGSSGSNSFRELFGEGTNAPDSGGEITQVRARIYDVGDVGEITRAEVFTNNRAEYLGMARGNYNSTPQWGDYVTLTTPTGGWSWSTIQLLETAIYVFPDGFTGNVYRVEIEVTAVSGAPMSSTVAAKVNILASLTKTQDITSQIRIKNTQPKTTQAKLRVKLTNNTRTLSAKVTIETTATRVIQTKMRTLIGGIVRTIQAKLDIKRFSATRTLDSKIRIKDASVTKTVESKVRVKIIANARTANSKTRIKVIGVSDTIDSKIRVFIGNIGKTLSAKTDIKVTASRTIDSKVNVAGEAASYMKNVEAKVNIVCIEFPALNHPELSGSEVNPIYLKWTIPACCQGRNMHCIVQVDQTGNTFNDLEKELHSYRDNGFEYWDGNGWVSYPTAGVLSDYYHNEARVQVFLTSGNKYWRVRGLVK